jgi:hypothetical protein
VEVRPSLIFFFLLQQGATGNRKTSVFQTPLGYSTKFQTTLQILFCMYRLKKTTAWAIEPNRRKTCFLGSAASS